jgi:hypothetical protein
MGASKVIFMVVYVAKRAVLLWHPEQGTTWEWGELAKAKSDRPTLACLHIQLCLVLGPWISLDYYELHHMSRGQD